MILIIDTSQPEMLTLSLEKERGKVIDSWTMPLSKHSSAELLLAIDKILEKHKLSLEKITEVLVNNKGAGFTSLRLGVVTANALAYSLGIPVQPIIGKSLKKKGIRVAEALYSAPPTITVKK